MRASARARGGAAALAAALLSACSLVRPLHGLTCEPGAGNASCLYGQPCDASADCTTAACTEGVCQCPAGMVTIESSFCIDQTEVSNAAYRAFLATQPDVAAQEPFCSFNATFDFDDTGPDAPPVCTTRRKEDEHPATCVDWCDARAFCKSQGKRLCGERHGGPLQFRGDMAQGEWFDACSKHGALAHSTGEFDALQCNGDSTETVPVGDDASLACEGGYLGLQHMSGNVREWEDACSDDVGPGDLCRTRGGAFDSGGALEELRCDARDERERADTDHTIGFRCCSG